jgi:hypothetical protein
MLHRDADQPEIILSIEPIRKWHYKIKDPTKLSEADDEYPYWRYCIER